MEYIPSILTSWVLMISCVDSILINGKGSVYCPGVDFLIDQTSTYMKYGLFPRQVNDKGYIPPVHLISFFLLILDRCFPFMKSTQGPYLSDGKPDQIPLHLQEGCIPSTGQREVVEVDAAMGWASLSFIGAATFKTIVFSIDKHPMWVYEVDGQLIEPQLVDTVHMYAGERYSVLVRLDKAPRDYTIRIADNGLTQVISEYATLRYKGGLEVQDDREDLGTGMGVITYGGQNASGIVTLDRAHLPPYPPNPPARHSDAQHVLHTHRWGSAWQYTLKGGGTYEEDRSAYEPLLYHPNSTDALDDSLVVRTKNGTWVDLIVQVGSLADQPQEFPHMMHKHTGKTWQIGAGEGIWNYSSVDAAIEAEPTQFNLVNPNWRDTFVTSFDGPAWLVLRYQVTNPGPWLFHCHIETHLAGGMAVAILDGVDAWPHVPPEYGPDQRGYPVGALASAPPSYDIAPSVQGQGHSQAANDSINDQQSSRWNSMLQGLIGLLQSIMAKTTNGA